MGFARRQGPALGCWHRRGRGFGPATDDASAGKDGPGGGTRGGSGGGPRTQGGPRGSGCRNAAGLGRRSSYRGAPPWRRIGFGRTGSAPCRERSVAVVAGSG